jgi:hypothetical protein
MSVRDRILPVIDRTRGKIASLGLRRYTVVIRRRRWSGARVGDGTATNTDTVLTPTPKVTELPANALGPGILTSGGTIEDRYFAIERITPSYIDPRDGQRKGYQPGELRLSATAPNEEVLVLLIGDDGRERACTLVSQDFSKPFRYQLVIRLKRRDT